MQTKNIFIFMLVIAALLWLFLSKSDPNVATNEAPISQSTNIISNELPTTSKISPIRVVDVAQSAAQMELDDKQRIAAQAQFDQAAEQVVNQQWQDAERSYLELIEKLPFAIEPYINLSAVFAETNRMEEAREILLIGVKANPNYAQLFDNLQSIHGALAADAYRAALASDEEGESLVESEVLKLDLPMIASMDLRRINLNRLQELEKELAVAANSSPVSDDDSLERVAELEALLSQREEQLKLRESELQRQTATLAKVERELIAAKQSNTIEIAAVSEPVATIVPEDTATSEPITVDAPQQSDEEKYDIALSLVKQWAGSWSQQDVDSYISHYADNYSPPRTQLTHQDWLEQRQVRLTNKKFIQIDVTDFDFQESDDSEFSVTFTQRYRSNTIDDTIRKRLVFVSYNDALLDAKIVDEIIVKN